MVKRNSFFRFLDPKKLPAKTPKKLFNFTPKKQKKQGNRKNEKIFIKNQIFMQNYLNK